VNLKKWFEDISGVPAQIENDANSAALAEAVMGTGKAYDKVFYVTLGSGVGGGYVINKEIYHGETPGEAEIGQMRYDKTGATFESLCSGWAVDKKLREYVSTNPLSPLAKLVGKNTSGEAKFVVQAIQDGDTGAKAIMEETADNLAFGLSHVVHLFHPEIIILGGGLSLTGELLRGSVYSNIPKYVMKTFHPITDFQIAGLGEDVVAIGALLLAQKISSKK
jgi:glucokinase